MSKRPLEHFEKEQILQERQLVVMLGKLTFDDPTAANSIALRAAKIAHNVFMQDRFGAIAGESCCVVYANMGPDNLPVMDHFVQRVESMGDTVLATAIWPKRQPYTFAVIVQNGQASLWQDELEQAWMSYWDAADRKQRQRKKRKK